MHWIRETRKRRGRIFHRSDHQESDGVWIGPVKYPVWRDETEVMRYPGSITMIANPEIDRIKAPFVETLLEKDAVQRAESPVNSLAEGGQKIRDLDKLGFPGQHCGKRGSENMRCPFRGSCLAASSSPGSSA